MVLDRSDVRSTLASYGASPRPTPTDFVACEYVRFYDEPPQETTDGSRTWYCRGQNFVLAYTQVQSGVEFTRINQADEYTVFVPDRDGPSLEITADNITVPATFSRISSSGYFGDTVRVATGARRSPLEVPSSSSAKCITQLPPAEFRLGTFRVMAYDRRPPNTCRSCSLC